MFSVETSQSHSYTLGILEHGVILRVPAHSSADFLTPVLQCVSQITVLGTAGLSTKHLPAFP